jgi:hypothetical protein
MRLLAKILALASIFSPEIPRLAPAFPPGGLRILVLERNDHDPAEWDGIRRTGANVVVTLRPPNRETDDLAGAAGLTYLAFFTTDEIPIFARDSARIGEARSERNLAGFYFWDARVVEGFTTAEAQQQAYSTLKLLFPDKLVLYPTRLDPIAWSPNYLDLYFRPEFTDLVTPYFYPVGTTGFGAVQESDAWTDRFGELLSPLAARVPPGKGLLPVLQGFEQQGYPVSSNFLVEQLALYRKFWPDLPNAIVYAWRMTLPDSTPLIEIAGRPDLEEGACNLFRSLSRRSLCPARVISWR